VAVVVGRMSRERELGTWRELDSRSSIGYLPNVRKYYMNTSPAFVPAPEAAYIGGVSLREMNRLVDEDLVPKSLVLLEGGTRRFSRLAAAYARFFRQTEDSLQATARKQVMAELTDRVDQLTIKREQVLALRFQPGEMNWKVVFKLGLQVDVTIFVVEAIQRANEVDSAETLVSQSPDVMGGQPCFAGTRVPIENILASLDAGVDKRRLIASYPFLNDAHIEAAQVYRQVHPRRGRLRDANPSTSRRLTRTVRTSKT
jgi:uncharacterized protein (DUF433 family)